MRGEIEVMRERARQLREQGIDLRALADRLVAETASVAWSGGTADALRERVRERADRLHRAADRHDAAAASLERHLAEVDRLQGTVADDGQRTARLGSDGP